MMPEGSVGSECRIDQTGKGFGCTLVRFVHALEPPRTSTSVRSNERLLPRTSGGID